MKGEKRKEEKKRGKIISQQRWAGKSSGKKAIGEGHEKGRQKWPEFLEAEKANQCEPQELRYDSQQKRGRQKTAQRRWWAKKVGGEVKYEGSEGQTCLWGQGMTRERKAARNSEKF